MSFAIKGNARRGLTDHNIVLHSENSSDSSSRQNQVIYEGQDTPC